MSLAERRTRRQRVLPKRFRDNIPQPLVQALLPPSVDDTLENLPVESHTAALEQSATILDATTQATSTSELERPISPPLISQCFRTPHNAFRLLREYFSSSPPSHDPEELIDFSDLCDGHGENSDVDKDDTQPSDPTNARDMMSYISSPAGSFGPYPNESSFLLGEWYWSGGRYKSKEDFQSLLSIIGSPDFRPEDVINTKWHSIDTKLGSNEFDEDNSVENESHEWLDDDAGWRQRAITISVPFHSRSKHPGARDFFVGHLFHRSLVSVIKEKLSNPEETQHFHYEPFKLLWQPGPADRKIRVHGELYTSPAFLEVHQALQSSPNEPGCSLQKVVVALMFLSDATQLTQFGTAKLWPGYLMFGNDSKYRRCKPTCNLCYHIAYFQAVGSRMFTHEQS